VENCTFVVSSTYLSQYVLTETKKWSGTSQTSFRVIWYSFHSLSQQICLNEKNESLEAALIVKFFTFSEIGTLSNTIHNKFGTLGPIRRAGRAIFLENSLYR
jgi:hypothetical protein